jgi:hypothetical protein
MLEDRASLSPEMIVSLRAALADARYEHDRILETLRFLRVYAQKIWHP